MDVPEKILVLSESLHVDGCGIKLYSCVETELELWCTVPVDALETAVRGFKARLQERSQQQSSVVGFGMERTTLVIPTSRGNVAAALYGLLCNSTWLAWVLKPV